MLAFTASPSGQHPYCGGETRSPFTLGRFAHTGGGRSGCRRWGSRPQLGDRLGGTAGAGATRGAGQLDRHHDRVVRLLPLQHRRGAGFPALVLPRIHPVRGRDGLVRDLRGRVRRPSARCRDLRALGRPDRSQGHADRDTAGDGHLVGDRRHSARHCCDRRGRAPAARAAATGPGPRHRWGVERVGVDRDGVG